MLHKSLLRVCFIVFSWFQMVCVIMLNAQTCSCRVYYLKLSTTAEAQANHLAVSADYNKRDDLQSYLTQMCQVLHSLHGCAHQPGD